MSTTPRCPYCESANTDRPDARSASARFLAAIAPGMRWWICRDCSRCFLTPALERVVPARDRLASA